MTTANVTFELPDGLTFDGANSSTGWQSLALWQQNDSNTVMQFVIGEIAPNQTIDLVLAVTAMPDLSYGTHLEIVATAQWSDAGGTVQTSTERVLVLVDGLRLYFPRVVRAVQE
ncbi:MAG: hypothetical protein HC876_19815 [Chloroflexaceae bacterium]|nr:hypothetical protein [Chloroflexaceae bacterium]NJO07576.1 hypothetical protein [Chloroflexaceae bacterium]